MRCKTRQRCLKTLLMYSFRLMTDDNICLKQINKIFPQTTLSTTKDVTVTDPIFDHIRMTSLQCAAKLQQQVQQRNGNGP